MNELVNEWMNEWMNEWGAFKNFRSISLKQSLTVRGKLWCNTSNLIQG